MQRLAPRVRVPHPRKEVDSAEPLLKAASRAQMAQARSSNPRARHRTRSLVRRVNDRLLMRYLVGHAARRSCADDTYARMLEHSLFGSVLQRVSGDVRVSVGARTEEPKKAPPECDSP